MSPHERARLAENQVLENESLTADLTDSGAERLLNWAVICAHRLAMNAAAMSEMDADAYFETAMPVLQRVIRKISRIGASLPDTAPESIMPDLHVIRESASRLPDVLSTPHGELTALAGALARLSPLEAVNRLTTELTVR